MAFLHINYRMLPYKLFYFFCISAMSIAPYLGVFFKHLGLTASEIGIVTAARPVAIALFQPIFGYLIDRWQCPKVTVVLGGTAWIGSALVMGFGYPKPVQKSCELIEMDIFQSNRTLIPEIMQVGPTSNLSSSLPRLSGGATDKIAHLVNGFIGTDEMLEDRSWLYTTDSVQTLFYILFAAHVLFGVGYVPLHSIADAESVNTLQELDIDMAEYGKQRAFGSLGWGFAPLIFGVWMTAKTGYFSACGITMTKTDFRPMFVVCTGFTVGAVLSMVFFSYKWYADDKESTKDKFQKSVVAQLWTAPNMAVLLVVTFSGVCNGTLHGYLFWHLENIGATELIMAVASLCHSISEFLLGLVTGAATRQFGYFPLMTVGMITYLLRFVYYTHITQPWWILFSEILHSLTFLLTWNTALSYLSSVIPEEFRTSLASLLNGLYLGLGNAIGYIMGGYLIDAFGSVATFKIYTLICAGVTSLFIVVALTTDTGVRSEEDKEHFMIDTAIKKPHPEDFVEVYQQPKTKESNMDRSPRKFKFQQYVISE